MSFWQLCQGAAFVEPGLVTLTALTGMDAWSNRMMTAHMEDLLNLVLKLRSSRTFSGGRTLAQPAVPSGQLQFTRKKAAASKAKREEQWVEVFSVGHVSSDQQELMTAILPLLRSRDLGLTQAEVACESQGGGSDDF